MIPSIRRMVLAALVSTSLSYGYTVLTHEAIIDSVWDASLQKLLLKRFPNATSEELKQAHAYANVWITRYSGPFVKLYSLRSRHTRVGQARKIR